jgi:hypothetical protein
VVGAKAGLELCAERAERFTDRLRAKDAESFFAHSNAEQVTADDYAARLKAFKRKPAFMFDGPV